MLDQAPRNEQATPLTSGLVLLLAVACGVSAANLYYAQPLLHTIAADFHVGSGTAGLIVTGSQVGYAAGLGLLVPLGDMIERKRLVPMVLALTTAGLVCSALAPNVATLILLALIVGLGSVAAQMLVPLAASLADDRSRGSVVGRVMSGLLIGILLARTLSGLVADAAGWRSVYWSAAGLVLLLAIVLGLRLPREKLPDARSYRAILRSTGRLFLDQPVLRRRSALGALGFAAFSVFWTTVAFILSGPPFHYSETVIGLFGLVGVAGALCANVAGRQADHGRERQLTCLFALAILTSFGLLYLGRNSLWWLIVGIVVLDVGVQGLQVTNQSVIYALAPEARSRVNAAYMVGYFAGGATGSALAGLLYATSGWAGICALGAGIGALALGIFALGGPSARRVARLGAEAN